MKQSIKGIKEILTPSIKKQMEEVLTQRENPIFVFLGVGQYVNIKEFEKYIIDKDSFEKNGDEVLFNGDWISKVFIELTRVLSDPEMPYSIISFPQFCYLTSHIPQLLQDSLNSAAL